MSINVIGDCGGVPIGVPATCSEIFPLYTIYEGGSSVSSNGFMTGGGKRELEMQSRGCETINNSNYNNHYYCAAMSSTPKVTGEVRSLPLHQILS